MVFTRSKIVMEDNCFNEEPATVEMKFIGKQVEKLYSRAYELMKSVFNVSDSDIQETEYQWGKSEKGDKFRIRWWLHKDVDIFSYFFVRFTLSGQAGPKGSATLEVRGLLRTEYPQDTVWQKSLFYEMVRSFWHRMFYAKKREEYGEECRHLTVLFQNKVKEYFEKLQAGAPAVVETNRPDEGESHGSDHGGESHGGEHH